MMHDKKTRLPLIAVELESPHLWLEFYTVMKVQFVRLGWDLKVELNGKQSNGEGKFHSSIRAPRDAYAGVLWTPSRRSGRAMLAMTMHGDDGEWRRHPKKSDCRG